ncbi:MAG: glutamate 5-kinase [Paenibacillus macerans]|uniref:Glutamate 5-kinase n=1 Tax=Paenibacillus macerans TaxID=44252 RepID=A0A090YCI4_PAEMA|nr:glutamate 5-kinase [Paenibacillus macerans]KFM95901.1 glutamate 5-kinase 1 [Paenibacillus macerans]MBS5914502.1 glutamate 5-kinase [Paenibacillus macerans]MCY7558838.1 glutamate 5-kinase [Paenibacillus macerans]MDU7477783.1 glutamate 5-kinase [Paenibacillus macerans]MEC0141699.1 glutamate 5-kinase [Paenibacillus macerans]
MLRRIVVKIGSSSLTSSEGGLNRDAVRYFAAELAGLIRAGYQPLLVTSGAVAAGFREIGYPERPKLLHEKQAAAAVGQALLMQAYREALAEHRVSAAQVLLTRSDFQNRKRTGNASMAIEELLRQGVLPIINENDTVSLDELKFGDNDTLSALVANLIKAEHLLILTDMDGLYTKDPRLDPNATRIARVAEITGDLYAIAGGAGSAVGTGGMRSKIDAAKIASIGGVPVFVGKVGEPGDLLAALRGDGRGTYFEAHGSALPRKKQWLGFFSTPFGTLTVDAGAEEALIHGGRSLLPVGVKCATGHFHTGDVVEVVNPGGEVLGRGIVNYDAEQLQEILGLPSGEVIKKLEIVHRLEVIHRDEWISLKS